MRRLCLTLLALMLVSPAAQSPANAVENAVALYEITTELSMPHLEENLRYTITHERRCLTRESLHRLFPILRHPALAGCHLGAPDAREEGVTYPLVCEGHGGTTGAALWQSGEHRETGTLDIRLGGKNMTFFQRLTAIPLGACH